MGDGNRFEIKVPELSDMLPEHILCKNLYDVTNRVVLLGGATPGSSIVRHHHYFVQSTKYIAIDIIIPVEKAETRMLHAGRELQAAIDAEVKPFSFTAGTCIILLGRNPGWVCQVEFRWRITDNTNAN